MVERPSSMLYLISDLRQKQSPQRSEGIIILVCCSLSQHFDPVRRNCTSPLNRLLGSRSRQLPAAVIASVNNIETRPGPTCLQVETAKRSCPAEPVCWAEVYRRQPAAVRPAPSIFIIIRRLLRTLVGADIKESASLARMTCFSA